MTPVFSLDSVTLVRRGRRILDNVSLTVRPGEHWAILGPNGSGKTTLLNIVCAYAWPTDGAVTVLGDRYGSVDIREKRRRIGLVSSALFERIPPRDTFLEVVLSGRYASLGIWDDVSGNDTDGAREIVSFLGCDAVADRRYGVLSFGERQRALIGRALMAEPSILILDEPCEGLDMPAREKVLALLDTVTRDRGLTLVLVTHRVEEIPPSVTHALLMRDGRVAQAGPKAETVTSEHISRVMGVDVEILGRNGRLYAVVNSSGVEHDGGELAVFVHGTTPR